MSKLEDDAFLSQFTLVCITDCDCVAMVRAHELDGHAYTMADLGFFRDAAQERLNERCRRLGKPFYASTSLGMHGYIFADLLHHEYLVCVPSPLSLASPHLPLTCLDSQ